MQNHQMTLEKIKSQFWIAILLAYLVIRFVFTQFLDSFGPYASYILETILVLVAISLSGRLFISRMRLNNKSALLALLFLPLGFLIFKTAAVLQIPIPFDLKGAETLVFLLVVAPILEEAIFRFFIWKPIEQINPKLALVCTSLLFSYSHFHAFWFVPAQIHNFIYYQTIYTFLLALACGFSVLKYNSLVGAMLIHFMFNFGFYLASII